MQRQYVKLERRIKGEGKNMLKHYIVVFIYFYLSNKFYLYLPFKCAFDVLWLLE